MVHPYHLFGSYMTGIMFGDFQSLLRHRSFAPKIKGRFSLPADRSHAPHRKWAAGQPVRSGHEDMLKARPGVVKASALAPTCRGCPYSLHAHGRAVSPSSGLEGQFTALYGANSWEDWAWSMAARTSRGTSFSNVIALASRADAPQSNLGRASSNNR